MHCLVRVRFTFNILGYVRSSDLPEGATRAPEDRGAVGRQLEKRSAFRNIYF